MQLIDESELRGSQIECELAKFELKGQFDPTKRRKPKNNKAKRREKEKQAKWVNVPSVLYQITCPIFSMGHTSASRRSPNDAPWNNRRRPGSAFSWHLLLWWLLDCSIGNRTNYLMNVSNLKRPSCSEMCLIPPSSMWVPVSPPVLFFCLNPPRK